MLLTRLVSHWIDSCCLVKSSLNPCKIEMTHSRLGSIVALSVFVVSDVVVVVVVVVVFAFGVAPCAGEKSGAVTESGNEEGKSGGSAATNSVWNRPPL